MIQFFAYIRIRAKNIYLMVIPNVYAHEKISEGGEYICSKSEYLIVNSERAENLLNITRKKRTEIFFLISTLKIFPLQQGPFFAIFKAKFFKIFFPLFSAKYLTIYPDLIVFFSTPVEILGRVTMVELGTIR